MFHTITSFTPSIPFHDTHRSMPDRSQRCTESKMGGSGKYTWMMRRRNSYSTAAHTGSILKTRSLFMVILLLQSYLFAFTLQQDVNVHIGASYSSSSSSASENQHFGRVFLSATEEPSGHSFVSASIGSASNDAHDPDASLQSSSGDSWNVPLFSEGLGASLHRYGKCITGILQHLKLKSFVPPRWSPSGASLSSVILTVVLILSCIIFLGIVLLFIFLYIKQDVLLYVNYINRELIYLPSRFNLPFEDLFLTTRDGVEIHCWLIKYRDPSKNILQLFNDTPTLIFFHSNASNMSHRLLNIKELYHSLKCNLLCVEYRGYGISKGTPSEEGLKLDALAAWEYLQSRRDLNLRKVFLYGRSLGAAVSIDLAYKIQKRKQFLTGVIVENVYTKIPDMIDVIWNSNKGKSWRWFPLRYFKWACRNQWRNDEIVPRLSSKLPILFISGLKDELIPPWMTKRLFKLSKSRFKKYRTFPEGKHNYTWMEEGYFDALRDFIDGVSQIRG